eukprot:2706372-Pyramimonas_sp.AAC.1
MANHLSRLRPFDNRQCTGHHQHASVCNMEAAKAAQCTPTVRSVANACRLDLDHPAIPRHPDGRIVQPPSGGWGCSACADSVNLHSPCTAEALNAVGGTGKLIIIGNVQSAKK